MSLRTSLAAGAVAVLALAGCSPTGSAEDTPTMAASTQPDAATTEDVAGGSDATPSGTPTSDTTTPSTTPTPSVQPSDADQPGDDPTDAEDEAERKKREEAERKAQEEAERKAAEVAANKQLQERLAELGYYSGPIDGIIGGGSTAAIRAFQSANGLAVDGNVGADTQAALDGDPVTAAQAAAEREEQEREARAFLEANGYWGGDLHSALMAFQKVNGLSADGQYGPNTAAAMDNPRNPFLVGGPATRIEIDLDRQVVHWISGGSRIRTMNASSGNGETFHVDGVGPVEALTPVGTFSIERRISGLRDGALGGMYDPMYFYHGWALHGSSNVPAHPASHGCVRISRSDATWMFNQAPNGTAVVVHGSRNAFDVNGPNHPPIL